MEDFENSFFIQTIRNAQKPPPSSIANQPQFASLQSPPSCMMTDDDDDLPPIRQNTTEDEKSFSNDLFLMAEKRISELVRKNEELANENAKLFAKSCCHHPNDLEDKIAALIKENQALLKTIEKVKGEKIEDELGKVFDIDENTLSSQNEKDSLISRLKVILAKINHRRNEQQELIDELLTKVHVEERQVAEREKHIFKLREEISQKESSIQKAQEIITSLDEKIDEHLKKETDFLKKFDLLKEHNSSLNSTLESYKQTYDQLLDQEQLHKEHIKSQDREILNLNKSVKGLIDERNEVMKQSKELQDKLSQLESEFEATRKDSRSQISSLTKENQRLKIDIKNSSAEQEVLQKNLESKFREKETVLKLYNELAEKYDISIKAQQQLQSEISQLKSSPSIFTSDMKEECEQRISQLQNQITKLKMEVAKREKQITKVLDEKIVIAEELNSICTKLANSESQKVSLNDKISELELQIASFRGRIQTIESENSLLKITLQSNDGVIAKQTELYEKINTLKREVDKVNREKEQLFSENQRMKETHFELNQKYEQTISHLHELQEAMEDAQQNVNHLNSLLKDEQVNKRTKEAEVEAIKAELKVTSKALENEKQNKEELTKRTFGDINRLASENESLRKSLFPTRNSPQSNVKGTNDSVMSTPIANVNTTSDLKYIPVDSAVKADDSKRKSADAPKHFQNQNIIQAIRNARENLQNAIGTGSESPISSIADPLFGNTSPVLSAFSK